MSTNDLSKHWDLDRSVTFLNHGSFGACPRIVLEEQSRLRARLEAEPVRFFVRELDALLRAARTEVAQFVSAQADDLAFVPNATSGVNSVLRSLDLRSGDEVLTTDHEYKACRNALDYVAHRAGARVVVAAVPFPLESPDHVVEAILDRVTPRTRLALVDHVTSQTALVWPIARIVSELASRGVDTLVDGAHAPGMVPIDLARLGPAYYTANCHKWLCAPKGAAILYVRPDRQEGVHPLAISHGYNWPRTDASRFRLEFDWIGTDDPTAYLCVPAALRFMQSLVPGGWPAVMARNRAMVLEARRRLCEALAISPPCPDGMIGSMAALPIPDGPDALPNSYLYTDPLQDYLFMKEGIEVPVAPWPAIPHRVIRISAQLYNQSSDFEHLARVIWDGPTMERR